jgi:hypothetical protein
MQKTLNKIKLESLKEYGVIALFLMLIAVSSFYRHLPVSIHNHVLKIPYIVIIILGICTIKKVLYKSYKPVGIFKVILWLAFMLGITYLIVSSIRIGRTSFFAARQSMYPALIVLLGLAVFFAFDAEILTNMYFERDMLIICTLINIMQLIISTFTYGGVRASTYLENIMVFNCAMISYVPMLFLFLVQICQSGRLFTLKLLCIDLNIIAAVLLISISGSRSAVLLIFIIFITILIFSILVFRNRFLNIQVVLIFFFIFLFISLFYATDFLNTRESIQRPLYAITQSGNKDEPDILVQIPKNDNIVIELENSNTSRSDLWKYSVEEIKKSPIVGTGVVHFNCKYGNVVLKQGSHNILLEIWLVFGGFGLLIYLSIFVLLIFHLVKRLILADNKFVIVLYMVSIFSIFSLALLQPLLVMIFPNVILWTIIAQALYSEKALP